MGIKRGKNEWIFSIQKGKILSSCVPPVVSLNCFGNRTRRPQEQESPLGALCHALFLFLPLLFTWSMSTTVLLVLYFYFLSFSPLLLFILSLPLSFAFPSSFLCPPAFVIFHPLSIPSLFSLSLVELLIMKIWSLVSLWSQPLIFKVGNCVVYTKFNLLAVYFSGIWMGLLFISCRLVLFLLLDRYTF